MTNCMSEINEIDGNKVILDQTIFYPEGGGQLYDTGTIKQGNNTFEVLKVKRENGTIVHYLNDTRNLTLDFVESKLNWNRRYAFMKYHTLLHVISGYLYHQCGAFATGNQIYENKARIDLQFKDDIAKTDFKCIEEEVNKLIQQNHLVTTRIVSRKEAESIPGLIKTVVNLLPPSIKDIRLVNIKSIDEQPCGGTHVNQTKEIGPFSIVKIKNKGENIKRLEVILDDV